MSAAGMPTAVRHWWGEQVMGVLDEAGPAAARQVQRGQALARRGAVEGLDIGPGRIRGNVAEDRVSPYQVEIAWPVSDDAAWARAVPELAASLRPTASLLEGQLAPALVGSLASAGVVLIPSVAELRPSCTCGQRGGWCRHAAAVHTLASVQIDRDPTLLLTLRGRTREALLAALRRSDSTASTPARILDPTVGLTETRGELDAIGLHPAEVDDPAALLRQLGPPPGVDDAEPIAVLIERAAATAWRLAAGEGAEAADEEALLAELRAQRVATAASLAAALGREEAAVGDVLEALFARGEVLRTGSGERTRYRAAAG
ncbi:MAG: hypothetical protein R6V28_07055 [Nitriliruptoraceae bacterium]